MVTLSERGLQLRYSYQLRTVLKVSLLSLAKLSLLSLAKVSHTVAYCSRELERTGGSAGGAPALAVSQGKRSSARAAPKKAALASCKTSLRCLGGSLGGRDARRIEKEPGCRDLAPGQCEGFAPWSESSLIPFAR
ncbi:hypothetical protein ES703_112259 [subsurface metagenome]